MIKTDNRAVLLDLGGVLFENNPNLSRNTKLIQNLIKGRDLEATAKALMIERALEAAQLTPEFSTISEDKRNSYLGGVLLNYVRSKGIINDQDFLKARIEMVQLRDEKVLDEIAKTFPDINITVATADAPIGHKVIEYYLPEIAPHLQFITSDPDIGGPKTTRIFYDHAAVRLEKNGILVPTSNMILVDDDKRNLEGAISAGGTGVLFNPNDPKQDLQETILNGIEHNLRR